MAERQSLTPEQIADLTGRLTKGLEEWGYTATAELEPSGAPGRYRLYVVSKDFEPLLESERQSVLWRVLKEKWDRDDQLRITLSLALSEKEAQGIWS
ncbi:MAG TPA: hypothetical protein PLC79_04250 [Phycisphaerae bacterium]|nr:hypothetical protein [Phycisphaerae bacterium]